MKWIKKFNSELNPEVSISKGGKRIIHKDKYLIEIPYPRGKFKGGIGSPRRVNPKYHRFSNLSRGLFGNR